jgi:uncharacterized phage-associated protein
MSPLTETVETEQTQQAPATAFAVANWFLDAADKSGVGLTLARLQKFVYLAYGWYGAYYGESLFDDPILATQSGPVIVSLLAMFRACGKKPIKRRAEIFRDDKIEVLGFSIRSNDEELDDLSLEACSRRKEIEQCIVDVLTVVWKNYSTLPYDKLSNMMYRPDAPIGKIYNCLDGNIHDVVISPKVIREYFRELLGVREESSEIESEDAND